MTLKSDKTIPEYLQDFLDYLEIEQGLSNNSQKNYHRFLNKFLKWLSKNNLVHLRPYDITTDIISKYRLYLARRIDPITGKTLKKSTQNLYLISLRVFLNFFVEKNIASLPPEKIKLAKDKGDKEVNFLTLEQIEKLLAAPDTANATGLRDKAILETLFSTGLRVSELISLNRDQFKIKKNTEDLEISIIGKGEKIRTVYFSERTVDALRDYLKERNDMEEALFINYWRPAKKSNQSRRLTVKSVDDIVKKYVKIAGLPIVITPHSIRHSFATDLLSQGADLRLVQEFLGHKNISTTQVYTHVTNKHLRDIHKKLHGGRRKK
jgi:site-specific recombinase XerD